MLFLVGVGLANDDISMRAASALKRGKLYIDAYTSFIDSNRLAFIERIAGKSVSRLSRSDMEENAGRLVNEAKVSDVVIAVGGDPLIATTHKILAIEAEKLGVEMEVIHAPSIVTAAIGESGLDFYRFGAVCTVPMWREHYKPVAFYDTIYGNYGTNKHSLLLLDYSSESNSSMPVGEALRILEEAEKSHGKGLINGDTKVIAMASIGMAAEQKLYGKISSMKAQSFGTGPAVLIVPAKLESIERESMAALHVSEI
ncbi:MAG: diphthine synthase [Candidatus Micrarchaeia archaeon]